MMALIEVAGPQFIIAGLLNATSVPAHGEYRKTAAPLALVHSHYPGPRRAVRVIVLWRPQQVPSMAGRATFATGECLPRKERPRQRGAHRPARAAPRLRIGRMLGRGGGR